MELFKSVVGPAGSSKASLLILHGLFGSQRNWQSIARALSERLGRQVISADLRNHGKSVRFEDYKGGQSPVGEEMTWPLMVADIERLFKEINRPVSVIGHSLGGQLLMQTLFSLSSRETPTNHIQKALIVDIAPKRYDFEQSIQHRYIGEMQRIDGLPRDEAIRQFRQLEPDETILQFLFTNYASSRFQIPLSALDRGMIHLGKTFEIGRTSLETLFLKGGRSDYISDETILSRSFVNYQLKTIESSGHWPHYDNPQQFLIWTSEFVK